MEKIFAEIKRILEGKVLLGILCALGGFIIALLIFSAGVRVGFHKASFGQAWGENYMQNFGMMPPPGREFSIGRQYFPNAHGATGKIIKIELPNVLLQDRYDLEKIIKIDPDTKIQEGRFDVDANELKIDDFLVIIGAPNSNGVIEAKFIRKIPFPESL